MKNIEIDAIIKMQNNYPNNYPNSYSNELNDIQIKILQIVKKNPTITVNEIAKIIEDRGLPAIKWNIKQLKEKGIIERVGTTRRGKWIIL